MQIKNSAGSFDHLTYCSNIHPGESWAEVESNVHKHVPAIRDALLNKNDTDSNRAGRFGIGLRLSAAATRELAEPGAMKQFKEFLDNNQCYVFTINGFPYGPFHGTRVKEDVYLPDWKDKERLRYTNEIADVFSQFLPAGQTGTISTVPGAFKDCVNTPDDISLIASNLVKHVAHLARLERKNNCEILLALEPEPCCFLETIEESVDFFTDHLFSDKPTKQLADLLGVSKSRASELLHKHLTLCLDLCHAAVEFEDAHHCLQTLDNAGIIIGKIQISAGLRLTNVTAETAELLRPFDDEVYLHQVVENHGGSINRFADLPDAFAKLTDDELPREWRVHFHVPIFLDDLGAFSSTQFFIRDILALHKLKPVSKHLEVETYTWSVLPEAYKTQSIDEAIVREISWVREQLS
ncbi:sugar phosphate isomerase [Chromatiales bacterium (ex Bugula neritina AB1)]|nr:sugar phosphate isomerase [Chromatiales bacterium (ex Bugula neritina AB1)]